jgi:hypothetical protein
VKQHNNENIHGMVRELLFSPGVGFVIIIMEKQITFMYSYAGKFRLVYEIGL